MVWVIVYVRLFRFINAMHYDWSLFNNRDVSNKYTITLRNKFDTLLQLSKKLTLDDENENFVNAYIEAVAEYIPTKLTAK